MKVDSILIRNVFEPIWFGRLITRIHVTHLPLINISLCLHLFKKMQTYSVFSKTIQNRVPISSIQVFTSFYQTVCDCNRINQRFDAVMKAFVERSSCLIKI